MHLDAVTMYIINISLQDSTQDYLRNVLGHPERYIMIITLAAFVVVL